MSNENFVDYVKIFCRSGKGGSGSAHLHRDKLTRKGGPDGGDGGRGGHIVLKGKTVLLDDDHILDKKLGIERNIVQKFLNMYDPKESLIFFKNELLLAFNLSKRVIDYINGLSKKEKIYTKKLIDNLQNTEGIKIQISYLDFIYEIVEHYFGIHVPKSSDISNFLGSL